VAKPVIEIRVHGVSGTAPETLLDSPRVVQVAGDDLGRIMRPADPFGRPLFAPPLRTADGDVERVLEGYHWGRMTSGGWSKAIWALLFPFALTNVAYWMLPPPWLLNNVGRGCVAACRGILRLSGLALSSLLMAQVAVIVMDLVVNQCPGSSARCLGSVRHLAWFWDHPLTRSLFGAGLLILMVYIINRISTTDWMTPVKQTEEAPAGLPVQAAGPVFYAGDPDVPALRALHVTASLSTATLLILGGPKSPTGGAERLLWVISVVQLFFAAIAVTTLDDPTDAEGHPWHKFNRLMSVRFSRWLALTVLIAAAAFGPTARNAAAGYSSAGRPKPLPGSDDTVGLLLVSLTILAALIALLLILPAVQARQQRQRDQAQSTPRPYRPWAGGWFSAPIAAMAAIVGTGLGTGLSYTTSGCLHGSCRPQLVNTMPKEQRLRLPAFYSNVTVLWGVTALITAVFLVLGLARIMARIIRAGSHEDRLFAPGFLLQDAQDAKRRRRTAKDWQIARTRLIGGKALTGIAVLMSIVGLLAMEAQWLNEGDQHVLPKWIGALVDHNVIRTPTKWLNLHEPRLFSDFGNLGIFAVDSLALGLLYAVYTAARRPNTARQLGILWDLASYWPRAAHPFIPPCYAQKVVPELVDRVTRYVKDGHRVVLCGHSQGSLLVASTVLRLLAVSPDSASKVGLVTAGSQLQWAYPRGFPGVIDVAAYRTMLSVLGQRWRNLSRGTDPLGGPVLTWSQSATDTSLSATLLQPADASEIGIEVTDGGIETPSHARVIGLEHWLPDPVRPADGESVAVQAVAFHLGEHRHSDYWTDPEWDVAVARAADLTATSPGPSNAKT
jgi:hypothetical protein